ncbi:family U32 unassigned peptidase [Nanobdella aerobiophila]|uniref:Family U32 unassigned peptidase n=1 Tax=Nanobdella aerobiophila TaxID=2586965 RepID=A0A915SCL6_9ARCH|nr:hypothetical protein [Nanobdella aerobiophila]BBL45493.1 family U32 unassigned peptidase [Nanobdella aerobiophila]
MRSFNYLIEIILVISLVLAYAIYIKFPQNPGTYINIFNKYYTLYSGLASTYNYNILSYLENNNFDIISSINYFIFSDVLSSYDEKIDIYSSLKLYNIENYSCYEFLYPFPYLGPGLSYTTTVNNQNENYFLIDNYNGDYCTNISSSNDWYYVVVNYYNSTNISIILNQSYLYNNTIDPYSIFAYTYNQNPLYINYVNISYITNLLGSFPILNISLSLPLNYNQPLLIIFRADNSTYNYLTNFNNYQLSNNIPSNIVGYSISPFSWETLYISSQCLDQSKILYFNNYTYFQLLNSSYYPSQLSGATSITAVAWIYVNNYYYYSNCASGENYVSALATIGVTSYTASTFRQILLPINGNYYLGIDESGTIGYLPNYILPLNQWIFVFWEYNSSSGEFYAGFINQTGLYYGQLQPAPGWSSLQPLNLYYPPNETIYLGTPTSLYSSSPECTFNGYVYKIAFYNNFLTLNQIKNIYYSNSFSLYNPVVEYISSNYNQNNNILYGNNQNYNLEGYNVGGYNIFEDPVTELDIKYSLPLNYQEYITSSSINISSCYPINIEYSNNLQPNIQYNFWSYFNVNPVPSGYNLYSNIVYPYGLSFSKFTIYGS